MAKQKEDRFTADAFSTRRPGRPPVLHPKSAAQRAREYRARKRAGYSDPVKQAKSHSSELRSLSIRLSAMSADWGEVDEYFRAELERIAEAVYVLHSEFDTYAAFDGSCD